MTAIDPAAKVGVREKHNCSARVYPDRSVRGHPCSKNATLFEGDEWWCALHAPSKRAAKLAARNAQWDENARLRRERRVAAEARAAELSERLGVQVRAVGRGFGEGFYLVIEDE